MNWEGVTLEAAKMGYVYQSPAIFLRKEGFIGVHANGEYEEFEFPELKNVQAGVHPLALHLVQGRAKKLEGFVRIMNEDKTKIIPNQKIEITSKAFKKPDVKKFFDLVKGLDAEKITLVCL